MLTCPQLDWLRSEANNCLRYSVIRTNDDARAYTVPIFRITLPKFFPSANNR